MHRIVHVATQVWVIEYGNLSNELEKAVRHVAGVLLTDDYANRPQWRSVLATCITTTWDE